MPGMIAVVWCEEDGTIGHEQFQHGKLTDALEWLSYRQSQADNWGKCFEVRASDGRYIFHREFQQRFNL